MEKNKISANIRCPSCNGQLYPRILICESCGIKVEGEFVQNEFASLTPDELHFLRVFIQTEGRIREMEAALGVSYPTVKSHLASIKEKLNPAGLSGREPQPPTAASAGPGEANQAPDSGEAPGEAEAAPASPVAILEELEKGRISYKDALKMIKSQKKGKSNADHN